MDIGTLDRMGPGTDYHGLFQRVAYKLHQQCSNPATWCWNRAKEKILTANMRYPDKFGEPQSFHHHLQEEAFNIANEQPHISAVGAWYAALDRRADLAMANQLY